MAERPLSPYRRWFLRLAALYHRHWRKDESLAQHRRWLAAEGDRLLRLDYPLGPDSVVFEVGGQQGDFAEELRVRHSCKVRRFESDPRSCRDRLGRSESDPAVTCQPFGQGACEADGAVQQAGFRPFADVFAEAGVRQVDLLKVDLGGGEYSLLEHLISTGLIRDVVHLQVKFHEAVPGAAVGRDRLRRLLSKTHVEQWNFPFIRESWKRRRGGDGAALHTIGDSHGGGVRGLTGAFDLVGGVVHHPIGPKLMHSIGRDGLDFRTLGVADGDTVICCFGEIDCRCHVHKFGPDYRKTIAATVERYVDALLANLVRLPRLRLCVYNIPPPIRKAGKVENPDYPYLGTDEERLAYVTCMNELLAAACQRHGLVFVDVAAEYADEQGFLRDAQSDGNVHIADPGPLRLFLDRHLR